ncbi:unnamed protein product [Staurois parvus]|uniref:Uncharacterized protein n=1 Tax=Staurois parvus TaxID=386267 RepID=A0ABN9GKX2_9NEOB|nr:unnamed protein product [Staurois parvus]
MAPSSATQQCQQSVPAVSAAYQCPSMLHIMQHHQCLLINFHQCSLISAA